MVDVLALVPHIVYMNIIIVRKTSESWLAQFIKGVAVGVTVPLVVNLITEWCKCHHWL